MGLTKEERGELRRRVELAVGREAVETAKDPALLPGNLVLAPLRLLDTIDEMELAHAEELRTIRLELAAQQEEGRTLREQLAELQRADEASSAREDERAGLLNRCISELETLRAKYRLPTEVWRVPLDLPTFPEWDAEIERGRIRDALAKEMPRKWANAAVGLPDDSTSIIPECAPDCLTRQPFSPGKLGAICTCGAVRA